MFLTLTLDFKHFRIRQWFIFLNFLNTQFFRVFIIFKMTVSKFIWLRETLHVQYLQSLGSSRPIL